MERLDSGLTGNEHFVVANAYALGGLLTDAHEAAIAGLSVADTTAGRIHLLRKAALIEATMTKDEDPLPLTVENRLEEALDTSKQSDEHTAAWIDLETQKVWASILSGRGDCPGARVHAQAAREQITPLSNMFIPDPTATLASIDRILASCPA